ncbi:MAG TPA: ROK family protein [Candidatus Limnocylindrales bacterium]|nr:ROK family protein [Candidatus Limnocylindrales bacterium]
MKDYIIGIDLGGTNLRVAAITREGEIIQKSEGRSEVHRGREKVLEDLLKSVEEIQRSLQPKGWQPVAIGFGVPGIIKEGIVVQSPNFPDWDDFDLKTYLKNHWNLPLWIENDANAAALGELWMGAGKESRHFCCLTLGTGVGSGIIVDGRILHGADGMAGEAGHMVVDPEGPPCGCGGYGCLETYASATGLERMSKEALRRGAFRGKLPHNVHELSAKDLHNLAKAGDPEARQIFAQMGRYLGIGLVNLIQIFNTELIILGGGVTDSWEYFIPETEKQIQTRAYKALARRVKIRRALCGGDAGVLGAAYAALQGLKDLEENRRRRDERPWGRWILLDEGTNYKVKRLEVKPGQRLSLQKHRYRAEHWVVVEEGTAQITLDGNQMELHPNEATFIPQGGVHRITNPGSKPVVIIEVQYGTYLGEDDITRLQDDYGRAN